MKIMKSELSLVHSNKMYIQFFNTALFKKNVQMFWICVNDQTKLLPSFVLIAHTHVYTQYCDSFSYLFRQHVCLVMY